MQNKRETAKRKELSLGFIKPAAIAERIIVGKFEVIELVQQGSRNIWYTDSRWEDALISSYVAVGVCLATQPNTSNVASGHTSWLCGKSSVLAVGVQTLFEVV